MQKEQLGELVFLSSIVMDGTCSTDGCNCDGDVDECITSGQD